MTQQVSGPLCYRGLGPSEIILYPPIPWTHSSSFKEGVEETNISATWKSLDATESDSRKKKKKHCLFYFLRPGIE